jgi:hypothetical protein
MFDGHLQVIDIVMDTDIDMDTEMDMDTDIGKETVTDTARTLSRTQSQAPTRT